MKLYEKMDSKNTALIIVDVINSCAHDKCEIPKWGISFSKIRKIVPRLKKFISLYRKNINGSIIFIKTVPWKREFLSPNLNELYKNPEATYYSKDNTGFAEKFYLLSPHDKDVVISKNNYDAFTSAKLKKILMQKKTKYIVIAGVFGDGCVQATINGGFSAGYNFIILKDLIETTDVKIRQRLLKLLKEFTWPIMYGKTIDSKKFIESWKQKNSK